MNTVYIHSAPGPWMQEFVPACEAAGLEPRIANLENPGCIAWIRGSGPGAIVFRPNLHLTRFDACIRHLGILREFGCPILPSWPAVLSYDDKMVQAHQLQAFGLPHCETRVATCRDEVEQAAETLGFPLVVKLRSGAGALNVRRIEDLEALRRYAQRMLGRGLSPVPGPAADMGVNLRKAGGLRKSLSKAPGVIAKRVRMKWLTPRERGYVLMQRFYDGNDGDVRVTVLGGRAFVFKRKNRPGDFRASGSGRIDYLDPATCNAEIKLAFQLVDRLKASYLAVDLILDAGKNPLVVEYSPGFVLGAIGGCRGYVDHGGNVHPGVFRAADLMAQDIRAAELPPPDGT